MKAKMSAAQRMMRIQKLNDALKKENDLFKQYGVDANMGITEDDVADAEWAKANTVKDEAMGAMPSLSQKVGLALEPVTNPGAMSDMEKVGMKYGQKLSSRLEPKLHKAVSVVFPRRRA